MAQLYSDLLAKGGIPVNQPTNEERDLAAKQAIFDMYKTLRQAGYDSKSAYEAAGMRKTGASMPKEQPQQYDPSMLKDILNIKKKGIDIEASEMGITKKDIDIEKGRLDLQKKAREQERAVEEERIKGVLGDKTYNLYTQFKDAKGPQEVVDLVDNFLENEVRLRELGYNVDALRELMEIPKGVTKKEELPPTFWDKIRKWIKWLRE